MILDKSSKLNVQGSKLKYSAFLSIKAQDEKLKARLNLGVTADECLFIDSFGCRPAGLLTKRKGCHELTSFFL
ncbi:hypothetical protein CEY02_01300 [Bacillus pumilus]|uniref:Uncharacterized protein n=1 Tax=Bacillus pumilus TaxID=1408 RepID=A0A2A5J1Y1_BACPU|nr:hypothetical protein CEY02_01300 [Bacillus pumilus]